MENTIQEDSKTEDAVIQFVCFKMGREEYAIDITQVQEVIRMQKITPVPQMPDFVLGVVNIRGNVVPVFDLRKKFSLPQKPLDELSRTMILKVNRGFVSIIVDEVLDNIKINVSQIDPAPSVKLDMDRQCIKGLGELGTRMIIILDLDKVGAIINQDIAR